MTLPLMPKATAVWLVENTTLTFDQIAEFCGLHTLEVNGIADGEVAQGMKGFDPISNNQLTQDEITRCEADTAARLKMKVNKAAEGETKRRGPRYTPLSKRQDRPSAIAWLVKFHPELADSQISKLVGTTKPTIQAIRDRSHWNINAIQPVDPVALGLCRQIDLDAAVQKAAKRKAANSDEGGTTNDAYNRLMPTSDSLSADPEPRIPAGMSGLENFTLTDSAEDPRGIDTTADADSFFNLPSSDETDGEGDEKDETPR